MQKTNWILYRNDHVKFFDEDEKDGKTVRPIRALFRSVDLEAGQFLKSGGEIWILFQPHGENECVMGYKRVKIIDISRAKGLTTLNYQTFDPRLRSEYDRVLIVRNENISKVFTLAAENEGALEFLARDKAIFIGTH